MFFSTFFFFFVVQLKEWIKRWSLNVSNNNIELSNNLSKRNINDDYSIIGKCLDALCLFIGIGLIIFRRRETKLLIKKDKIDKSLDDYSYGDLFYFFLNEEYHYDKYHLAKGFSNKNI